MTSMTVVPKDGRLSIDLSGDRPFVVYQLRRKASQDFVHDLEILIATAEFLLFGGLSLDDLLRRLQTPRVDLFPGMTHVDAR